MTKFVEQHLYSALAFVVAVICIGVAFSLAAPQHAASAGTTVPVNGFAWSDTTGWISFNCATGGPNDTNICGTSDYGLVIDGSGNITGYAWSDNLGWISANPSDLSGCPSGPCTATINGSGVMSGWMRALSGEGSQTGGWDGWISLSGTSPSYGVTESNGQFSGYAWGGGTDVGWIDFEYASTTYDTCTPSTTYECTGTGNDTITQVVTNADCSVTDTNITACVAPSFCENSVSTCQYPQPIVNGALSALPALVTASSTATVSWNVSSVEHCTVTGSNGDSWSGLSGNQTTSPITSEVIYTLSCLEEDGVTNFTESATVGIVPKYEER
jgi:hypothetical protein